MAPEARSHLGIVYYAWGLKKDVRLAENLIQDVYKKWQKAGKEFAGSHCNFE